MDENEIGKAVVDATIRVHRVLGPGLLESVYEAALAHELTGKGLQVQRQAAVPFVYESLRFEDGYRADIVVNNKVMVEVKSVERRLPVHKKQLLTYLKLSGFRLGFLINFNESLAKDGIERLVNGLHE